MYFTHYIYSSPCIHTLFPTLYVPHSPLYVYLFLYISLYVYPTLYIFYSSVYTPFIRVYSIPPCISTHPFIPNSPCLPHSTVCTSLLCVYLTPYISYFSIYTLLLHVYCDRVRVACLGIGQ